MARDIFSSVYEGILQSDPNHLYHPPILALYIHKSTYRSRLENRWIIGLMQILTRVFREEFIKDIRLQIRKLTIKTYDITVFNGPKRSHIKKSTHSTTITYDTYTYIPNSFTLSIFLSPTLLLTHNTHYQAFIHTIQTY